jgi:hypothetical protein
VTARTPIDSTVLLMLPGGPKTRSEGIECAHPLFSHTKSTGADQCRAVRSVSLNTPWANAPSPAKDTAMSSRPVIRRPGQAAPAAQGRPPPTIAVSP